MSTDSQILIFAIVLAVYLLGDVEFQVKTI